MSAEQDACVSTDAPSTRRARSCSSSSQSSEDCSPQKLRLGSKSLRKTSSLPAETVEYLKAWMMSPEHVAHPYPTEQEKSQIMSDTGIELKQLTNWFVNNRKRYWKPRVEARLQQQAQVHAAAVAAVQVVTPNHSTVKTGCIQQPICLPFITLDMTQPLAPGRQAITPQTEDPIASFPDSGKVSLVSSETIEEFVRSSMPRTVSEASSSSSESDNSSFSNELDDELNSDVVDEFDPESGTIKRSEVVDVHILHPTGKDSMPTIEDVTILANVPPSRVARSYMNLTLTYSFPRDGLTDKKKSQSRRDAEVVRIKKIYLKNFLADSYPSEGGVETASSNHKESTGKRARPVDNEIVEVHRPKYFRKCTKVWLEACRTAVHGYDQELPSLDEAAHLFGYSS